MGLKHEEAALWRHIPTLEGKDPLLLSETEGFEQGHGMRVLLFPYHLLIETAGDDGAYLLLPLDCLFEGLASLNKQLGS